MTLANKITVLRIISIPIIVIALLTGHTAVATVLLALSIFTDLLDGIAARMRGEQTKLGAFLDPMADKLLLVSVFLTLTFLKQIPIWMFVVVFSRDLLIVLGWAVIYILTRSSKITPRILGKTTTAIQMATAFLVIWNAPVEIQRVFIWMAVVVTAFSTVDYIIIGERRLGQWEA